MPRSLGRHQIGYSQRTGRKVRAVDLVEDGENKGLIVARDEADREHPQKYAKRIPADRIWAKTPMPDPITGACTIHYGFEATTNLWEGRAQPFSISLVMGGFEVTAAGTPPAGMTNLDFSVEANSGYLPVIGA